MTALPEVKTFYKLIDLVNATQQLKWNYESLSRNRNIYPDDISNNLLPTAGNSIFPFNKTSLSFNPNITLDFVLQYPDISTETVKWSWNGLTRNKNINIYDKIKNLDLPWIFKRLTESIEHLDNYDFLLEHPDKPWDWEVLSYNVPFSFILEHPELPWVKTWVSTNETITFDDIIKYQDFKWDYDKLSWNIPLDILTTQTLFPINYDNLSINNTLTSKYLLAHVDEKWNNVLLSKNENLNFDVLAKSEINLTHLFIFDYFLIINKSVTKSFIFKYFANFDTNSIKYLYEYKRIKIADFNKYPIFEVYTVNILKYCDINLEYLKHKFPGRIMSDYYWLFICQNKHLKLDELQQIENWFNKKISFYVHSNNIYLNYDYIYINRDEDWDGATLSNNNFDFEFTKRNIVNRLKNNFLDQKKKKLLQSFLIPDLNNIIIHY
jgi:hypothetical protein